MNDALDQPLVVGNRYGYSASYSGRVTIVVGILTNIGAKKATLKVESSRRLLYGEDWPRSCEGASTVSVQSCHLFPVSQA